MSTKETPSKRGWQLLSPRGIAENVLRLIGVGIVCGILVAALLIPAGFLTTTAVAGTSTMLSEVPSSFTITRPAQTSKVLANNGEVIATFYDHDRQDVPLSGMSPFIRNGIVAIEDARFYEHGGIDPKGIARALVATVKGGREGASTITQQYVNNVIIEKLVSSGKSDDAKLGGQKTVADKLNEIKLSIALEKKMSKDDILAGYLNIIYFGNGAYGIQAASKLYFNVDAKNLSLPQAAALAGVINSPTFYDPLTNPDNTLDRRNDVLAKMLEQKSITQKQHDDAVKSPLGLNVKKTQEGCVAANSAPYFCDYVQQVIVNSPEFGSSVEERTKLLYQGGLTIKTSLDPALQKVAQESVNASMSAKDPLQRGAAVVSIEPGTGKVLTMAQNTIYTPATGNGNSMLNFALPLNDANGNSLHGAGGFQLGSTVKPIIFAEWLNSGHSMMTSINGAARRYPTTMEWKNSCGVTGGAYDPITNPGSDLLPNDDPNHYFSMSAMEGLYNSINTVTFQTAAALDMCNIQKMATNVGVTEGKSNKPYDLSTISNLIGSVDVAPINLATMMATFAADGVKCDPIALTSVTDSAGKKYNVPKANCKQTVKKEVAQGVKYALQQMLVRGSGYALPLNDKSTAFAKTGTTDGNTMTWTVGANSGISTASWFGSYKGIGPEWVNQDITINGVYWAGVDGANLAGTQWTNVMNKAAENPAYQAKQLETPPAEMLAYTAPLVIGANDPKGTDVQAPPVVEPSSEPSESSTAEPSRSAAPTKPAAEPTKAPAPQVPATQAPVTQNPKPQPSKPVQGGNSQPTESKKG